jgi:16S rRNA processing protein RimM
MRSKDRKILIGKLGKPHGIQGFVYFHYYGKDLSTLKGYKDLYIDDFPSARLEKMFEKRDRLIIKLSACDSRNTAEELRNKEVYILENNLPDLKKGEYYLYELEGLVVKNLDSQILGEVKEIFGTKANEVLIVKNTDESIDDKERLIPYVKPQVVKEILLEEGVILVDWHENY